MLEVRNPPKVDAGPVVIVDYDTAVNYQCDTRWH